MSWRLLFFGHSVVVVVLQFVVKPKSSVSGTLRQHIVVTGTTTRGLRTQTRRLKRIRHQRQSLLTVSLSLAGSTMVWQIFQPVLMTARLTKVASRLTVGMCPHLRMNLMLMLMMTMTMMFSDLSCKSFTVFFYIHCAQKNVPLSDCPYLCQILTDF